MSDMTQYGETDTGKDPRIGKYFKLLAQGKSIRENRDSITAIWEFLKEPMIMGSAAMEAFEELKQEDQMALWTAPSYGGIWETWEKDVLRYGEVKENYFTAMARQGMNPIRIQQIRNEFRER